MRSRSLKICVMAILWVILSIGLPQALATPVEIDHSLVSYIIDSSTPASGGTYSDNTGDDLANGYVAGFELSDPDWVGFIDGPGYALLTFDLGEIYELSSVDVTYMVYTGAGIWVPENMEVSFSTDGAGYTSPITLTGFTEFEWSAPTINFSISGNTGRYVKIKVNANDYRTNVFTFLSEFTFVEVPEPATLLLLGLGSLMLRKTRR